MVGKGKEMSFCSHCGNQLSPDATFCDKCGAAVGSDKQAETMTAVNPAQTNQTPMQNNQGGIRCPSCGSTNVDIQTFQEQKGTASIAHTHGSVGKGKHGCLWWILIGWWWEILSCVYLFPIKLIATLKRKRREKSLDATTAGYAHNIIAYKTVCTCKNCGHHWKK